MNPTPADLNAQAESLSRSPAVDLLSLFGRVAVVTGAARGIGLAIGRRLAEAGARVVLSDVQADAVIDGIGQLPESLRDRLIPVAADVAQPDQIEALADYTAGLGGGLHIWVNNAGIYPPTGSITDATDALFTRINDINCRGVFNGIRAASRRMGRGGVIVNIASLSGLSGHANMAAYSASKYAVIGLTKTAALELGPRGIRVVGIAPGNVLTPGVAEVKAKLDQAGVKTTAGAIPLGRSCLPDDIARVALFAVSDLAAMISGDIIVVDGGASA